MLPTVKTTIMTEKKVKCRKDYVCDQCDEAIRKGEYAIHGTDRQPKYDDGDNQIGIDYVQWRMHGDPNVCNTNNGW